MLYANLPTRRIRAHQIPDPKRRRQPRPAREHARNRAQDPRHVAPVERDGGLELHGDGKGHLVHGRVGQLVDALNHNLLAQSAKGRRVRAVFPRSRLPFVHPAEVFAGFGGGGDAGEGLYEEGARVAVVFGWLDGCDVLFGWVDLHSVGVASGREDELRVLGRLDGVSIDLGLHRETGLRGARVADGSAGGAGAAHGLLDGVFGRDAAEADFLRAHGHIGVVGRGRLPIFKPVSVSFWATWAWSDAHMNVGHSIGEARVGFRKRNRKVREVENMLGSGVTDDWCCSQWKIDDDVGATMGPLG